MEGPQVVVEPTMPGLASFEEDFRPIRSVDDKSQENCDQGHVQAQQECPVAFTTSLAEAVALAPFMRGV